MPDSTAISTYWAARRRKTRRIGGGSYLVVNVEGVKGCPPDLMADVAAAVEAANDAARKAGPGEVVALPPTASPHGPFIAPGWTSDENAETQHWFDQFASTLADLGRTATVKPAPRKDYPRAVGNDVDPRPATLLAYTLTDPIAPLHNKSWGIPDEVAQGILRDAPTWIHQDDADLYLSESVSQVRVDDPDLPALLGNAIGRSPSAAAMSFTRRPPCARRVRLECDGQVAYTIVAPDTAWQDNLPDLRAALLRDPAHLDIGIITSIHGFTNNWTGLDKATTRPPFIRQAIAWDRNRHMWSRFVPDAYPIQVLTPDHIAKANDLSGWDLTKLPGYRWLVETRDLHAWFDNRAQVPDDVLTQARHDFGAMIITTEDIQNDPNGWLGGPYAPARM